MKINLKLIVNFLVITLLGLGGHAAEPNPPTPSKLVTPFQSVTCASLMIMLGKAAQFSQSDSNHTRNAINSMMDFRWNELQPKNNEDTNSYNLVTDSSGTTAKDKEKMSKQILKFEKIYREAFLENGESPESSVVVSGLHLTGNEVIEFFDDLKAMNERLQSLSWQARRDFYKAWFTTGTKFILTQRAPLIAVPHILKLTPLVHVPLVELAASLVGVYGFAQTMMWAIAPGFMVPVAWAGAVDYKFKQRFDNIQSLINNPKEGSWIFQSFSQAVDNSYTDYWRSPNEHYHPLYNQAMYEAYPSATSAVKRLMSLEVGQLLTFKKDANSQLVPTLDVVIRFAKDSPPAPKKVKEEQKAKASVLVPAQVPSSQ